MPAAATNGDSGVVGSGMAPVGQPANGMQPASPASVGSGAPAVTPNDARGTPQAGMPGAQGPAGVPATGDGMAPPGSMSGGTASEGAGIADGDNGSGAAGDSAADPADPRADSSEAPAEPPPVGKFVGNITTRGQVREDFSQFWNQITPENEGKWASVEPERDQMNWSPLDRIYAYAKMYGVPFKQHTFVWGSQQPGWIARLSPQEQRAEVEEWIRLYCERYPDTQLIDVVNEPPPHTTPPYAEALGGAGASGYDWIVQAFKWSRQYCPNAILILNDYNNIEYPNDNTHFVDIVRRVVAAGAPVDALGAQSHDAYKRSNDELKGFIDNLASTGLPVYISEYDINVGDDGGQKEIMERQFPLFWEHPSVKGITLWGYVTNATWLPDTGLISESGDPRPAMQWLMDFMAAQRP